VRSTPAFCLVALVFLPGCSSLGNGLCPKSLWNWASRDEVKVAFDVPGDDPASVSLAQDSDERLALDGRPVGHRVRWDERALMLDEARREHALRRGEVALASYELEPGTILPGAPERSTGIIVVKGDELAVLARDSKRWNRYHVSQGSYNRASTFKEGVAVGTTVVVAATVTAATASAATFLIWCFLSA